jgi:uncharacterized protein YydD (DUF2326 family)
MRAFQRGWYEMKYRLEFRSLNGTAFQDFFSSAMELRFPGDFQRIKPCGKYGDRKCDGYQTSHGMVFQLYAPESMHLASTLDKIDEDFDGALKYWQIQMLAWTFVHNQWRGIPADVIQRCKRIASRERDDIASAEAALSRARVRVADFRVLPDFRAYEEEASALTQQIGDRSNANTTDEDLLAHLDRAISEEQPVATSNLEQMYRQAGVLLPDAALWRFDEVRSFHDSVIANRKLYLTGEMEAARKRIADREAEKQALSERRAQLMGILQSHGALDQFTKLQSELSRKEAALELLQRRFKAAEKIEQWLTKQNIRRQELLLRLRQDYAEQAETLSRAIVLFEEVSAELYERPARFTPTETLNGPAFTIEGQADRSPGIGNMQIFCFDVMLSRLMAERGLGPGFLVHDSHIFDPVDSRQVGSALQYASKMADDLGIQYIVTLNSDKQLEFPVSFDLKPHLLSSKLTDAAETGGLFGLRFG